MALAESTLAEATLPADAVLGIHPERRGPVLAADFERWPQEPDNPMELIGGWVVAMSPIGFSAGREASGFGLQNRVYVPLEADDEGFFPSRVLGARLRLVPAALKHPE